jgi:hypothetical protein
VRRADVVNVDPAIAPDVVSLLLLEGMRECWLVAILII